MPRSVNIIIWQQKAYLPTLADYEYGGLIDMEPVLTSDLAIDNLLKVVKDSFEKNLEQQIYIETNDKDAKSPILVATGAKSWKELTRTGAVYAIKWVNDSIRIDISYTDKKGRFQFDRDKVQVFNEDTDLRIIVSAILVDFQSRSDLTANKI